MTSATGPIVLKKSHSKRFQTIFGDVDIPKGQRSKRRAVLDSRVTDLSLAIGKGAEFFNTIDPKPTLRAIWFVDKLSKANTLPML